MKKTLRIDMLIFLSLVGLFVSLPVLANNKSVENCISIFHNTDSVASFNSQPLVEIGFLSSIKKSEANEEFRQYVYTGNIGIITIIKSKNNKLYVEVYKTFNIINKIEEFQRNSMTFITYKELGVDKENRRIFVKKVVDTVYSSKKQKDFLLRLSENHIQDIPSGNGIDNIILKEKPTYQLVGEGLQVIEVKSGNTYRNMIYNHYYNEQELKSIPEVKYINNINHLFSQITLKK